VYNFPYLCFYLSQTPLLGTITTAFTRMIYKMRIYLSAAEGDLNANGSDLIVFNYLTIKVATDNFSKENKLGEGGFGAVYKVTYGNTSVGEIFHEIETVKCKLKIRKVYNYCDNW